MLRPVLDRRKACPEHALITTGSAFQVVCLRSHSARDSLNICPYYQKEIFVFSTLLILASDNLLTLSRESFLKGIFRSCAVLPALAATFSIMLAGSPTLLAQSGVPKINAQCLPSLGNGNICTANDLNVRSIAIAGPDACTEGELIDVTFEFEISKSANFLSARAADERNTIGFFIGELGEPVIEGNSCTFSSLVPLAPPLNLSGGSGGYRNINGDVCGDILADDVTVHNVSTDQVLCKDGDGDGKLDLDFAVTWETNKNRTCSSATDETEFIPSTSSKCLLNPQFDYDIDVERPPALELVKTAIPDRLPAPGGPVLYRVLIVNDSDPTDPIVISSLEDDIYGDLDGKGDCSVPQTIAPGAAYSCEFTEQVTGNAGAVIRDEIVAMGTDDEGEPVSGSDTADVFIRAGSVVPPDIDVQKFADPVELFEPGGDVSYSVLVQNTGASSVVLNSLTDQLAT